MSAGTDKRRATVFGATISFLMHLLFATIFLSASAGTMAPPPPKDNPDLVLCDGMRCPMLSIGVKRRSEDRLEGDPEILEAMIIPKLGRAKPKPKRLPKLLKYEQPKKEEVAINIKKDNQKTKVLPKADKPKEAELDKRKPSSLDDLLKAPDDDDARKRAASLDQIIGHEKGDVEGAGREFREGDLYFGKVALAIRRRFVAPQAIDNRTLRKLRVTIHVLEIKPNGTIAKYKIKKRSGNRLFDAAAIAAVKGFVPSEGGSSRLPKPNGEVLNRIRGRGLQIELDGRQL